MAHRVDDAAAAWRLMQRKCRVKKKKKKKNREWALTLSTACTKTQEANLVAY